MGSTFGNILKVSIFGESHGTAIGATIDNFPCGIKLDMDFILSEMARRAPSSSPASTARREPDLPRILSGVKDGVTTGAPICMIIENTNAKSGDYSAFSITPRPGHADLTGSIRYAGHNDANGGGHFSGRLTAPMVFVGALAKLALAREGVSIGAHILKVGNILDDRFDEISPELLKSLRGSNPPVINENAKTGMYNLVSKLRTEGDSVGGCVECAILGSPAGLGSPIFEAVESRLSHFLFSIPAVRGVEFGAGFSAASMLGSNANDSFYFDGDVIKTKTNNHGGVLGGITTGMPIVFRCAFKPTPSIYKEQDTVNLDKKCSAKLKIEGRHDPCIVYRAVPVVEAAAATVMLDLFLEAYGYEKFR